MPRKMSDKRLRRKLIEANWDEIEKNAIALQSGQLEAFEMYATVFDDLVENAAQIDMYMAVVFELLPPEAQRKMLADPRISQSQTVITILKSLRAKTNRPKSDRS